MTRKVKIKAVGHDTIVNYPTSFEGSEVQNLIEQEVVSGYRWDVNITTGAQEFTSRIESELVSGLPFYLALGSISPGINSVPCTIVPSDTLPDATIVGASEGDTLSIKGAKCDRLRLNWSAGEFVTYEAEFTGLSAGAEAISESSDWSLIAPTGASVRVMIDGTTLDEMQSGNLEIRNNLEARYACGKGKNPQKVREQRLEVSGAITVGQDDISKFGSGGHSLNIRINGTGTSSGYLEIRCGSIWFDELPTEFSGHDVYEVEFSWTAQPISGGDIIKIIDNTSAKTW